MHLFCFYNIIMYVLNLLPPAVTQNTLVTIPLNECRFLMRDSRVELRDVDVRQDGGVLAEVVVSLDRAVHVVPQTEQVAVHSFVHSGGLSWSGPLVKHLTRPGTKEGRNTLYNDALNTFMVNWRRT